MTAIQGNPGEIRELARYEVRPESIDEVLYPKCLAPVEFIEYRQVDANA